MQGMQKFTIEKVPQTYMKNKYACWRPPPPHYIQTRYIKWHTFTKEIQARTSSSVCLIYQFLWINLFENSNNFKHLPLIDIFNL